jgi:hypothetical protein
MEQLRETWRTAKAAVKAAACLLLLILRIWAVKIMARLAARAMDGATKGIRRLTTDPAVTRLAEKMNPTNKAIRASSYGSGGQQIDLWNRTDLTDGQRNENGIS